MAALVLDLAVGRGVQTQTFAAFGASKRITLPLAYLLFALAAVLPSRAADAETDRPRVPAWLWMPLIGILVSLAATALVPAGRTNTSDILQGLALFAGFTLIGWVSMGATHWDEKSKLRFTWLLLGGALICGLMGQHGVTPFLALSVPGFYAALLLTVWTVGRRRLGYLVLALVMGFLMVRGIQPNSAQPASAAVVAQIVICGALVALILVPRTLRPPLVVVSVLAAIVIFVQLQGVALLTGELRSTDVTIAQRSFEAAKVSAQVSRSTVATLLGSGPGATVDLSTSPDVITLAASGRDVLAVDDVHLLTSYLLLKLGAFGLVWFGVLLVALAKVTAAALRPHPDRGWRLMMLVFLLAGVVNSLPAATNLFANPLVPMCLGLLWAARDKERRPQEEGGRNGSKTQVINASPVVGAVPPAV